MTVDACAALADAERSYRTTAGPCTRPAVFFVDGVHRVFQFTYTSLGTDAADLAPACIAVARDVTDRLVAEERAAAARWELSRVARLTALGAMGSTIAHELNQPLAVVANCVNGSRRRLEATGVDDPAVSDALRRAADAALHAGAILHKLRDFAANGSNRHVAADLFDVARDACDFSSGGVGPNQSVSLRFGAGDYCVAIDRVQIAQVVMNLVRNAFEACGSARAKVWIGAERISDAWVRVTVGDNGPGLPPSSLTMLFQPFETDKPEGMGLGLSICRMIVEAHGGIIAAAAGRKQGAAFSFTLPLAPGERP